MLFDRRSNGLSRKIMPLNLEFLLSIVLVARRLVPVLHRGSAVHWWAEMKGAIYGSAHLCVGKDML